MKASKDAAAEQRQKKFIFMIGDSDICRWPADLLPQVNDITVTGSLHETSRIPRNNMMNFSKDGAKLNDLLDQIQIAFEEISMNSEKYEDLEIIFVACAGENDVSSNKPTDVIMEAFDKIILRLFPFSGSSDLRAHHLIFFGPKLEPWLAHDPASRKAYGKLSKALNRACQRHNSKISENGKDFITYIDCLTMFCGESANFPGALTAGRAIPEDSFFAKDRLHLNKEGYVIWREVLETCLQKLI